MSEKRKPTTRYQGQRPPKRRQLSSTPPTPAPKQSTPKQAVENPKEELPVKLKESQSLPTQTEVQDPHLPDADFQGIAESGVLALSIQQSRHKWITEGIFDRYWTRPAKKKGLMDSPNPAKETMNKLGVCSMIIDPHVFEATLYTVRENQPVFMPSYTSPPPMSSGPVNPGYNPYQDHKTYQQQTQTSYSHGIYPQYHPQYPPNAPNLTLPPFREGFGQFSPSGPSIYHNSAPSRPVEQNQSRGTAPPPNLPDQGSDPSAIDGENKTDPVIQMLATRAASDHNLKALMKVVASGHASQDQLRDFQNHIDELNNLIKGQKGRHEPTPPQEHRPQPPPPVQQPQNYPAAPRPSPISQTAGPASSSPYTSLPPMSAHIKAEPPSQSPYLSHLAPPPKPACPKPDVISVVFDFSPNGDRFTFPRFSILEYLPGRTHVIASFLIIRKGSAAASAPGEYNKNLTYYQPVTIRLSAANPKVLEQLSKVVAPPDEVRKFMNGIFDKMSPAKPAYLTTRLPREKRDEEVETSETPVQMSTGVVKRYYSPPNSLVPLVT